MSTKLYVGNLSFDTTRDDLQDLFSQAGSVREATIIQDRNTGKSRGFAFVMMSSDEEATSAIKKFDGHAFQGRHLKVNEAKPVERLSAAKPARRY
jgi:cold-inducible RNA-binding protein